MRSLLSVLIVLAAPACCAEDIAQWVTVQPEDASASGTVVHHKTLKLDFDVEEAYLKYTCYTPMDYAGTHYRAYVNGAVGAGGSFWQDAQLVNVSNALRKGTNEIDIEVTWIANGGPGPILAKLVASGKDADGNAKSETIRSDASWTYAVGEIGPLQRMDPNRPLRHVVVAGAADSWAYAKSPIVPPKINTAKVVGVTDVKMKGGNAGSLFQFGLVRDYSDKFYFLKSLGYSSIEDYIFAQSNYQQPGVWFWGYDKQIAQTHERAGFEFTVYPWVWVPPEWYRKEKSPPMVRCIEHGQDGFGISLWSPTLTDLNEQIYTELAANFGASVRFIYPGVYGDFGEAHYMAGWNFWLQPKPEHAHAGFWAGDDLARADFRKKMLAKYASLDALNTAWKTSFASEADIEYPKLDGTDPRRRALDFVSWYYDCMTDFTARVCAIARKHFPGIPIAPKLGCGDENPMWGQDNSAIPEALAKIGVDVRSTHGSSPNFAVRRISSACKFYGNRFETETASGTNRNDAAKKFFIDASCGCAEVFEYCEAMLKVADIFSDARRHLRGEHSITEVALCFPTSWHRANLRQGYPPRLVQAAEEIRDVLDFDVLDENLVLDGALKNYRVLACFDGDFTEQAVWDAISRWVDDGGALVMLCDQLPFSNVEGEQLPVTQLMAVAKSGEISRSQGKGKLVVWADVWDNRQAYYELIHRLAFGESGVDGKRDGVWTSLFPDRLLLLNTTDAPVEVSGSIPKDFARRAGLRFQPERLKYAVKVAPKSIAAHFFDKPFVEFALECEEMDGAAKHKTEFVDRDGFGTPGRAVRMPADNLLRVRFSVDEEATYAFACLVDGDGKATLRIDGRDQGDIATPAGPHKFMYPLTARVSLKPGRHTLELRFHEGSHLADKVMVTTDTDLAGFAYGFVDPGAEQSW